MIALSTAFKKALIGVSIENTEKVFELEANCKHSENLLLSVDRLLNEMGKNIAENDSYGVVVGPGSFTGVRIAIALVQGLLAGEGNKKIVALTSFDLMAYTYIKQYKPDHDFICVLDGLSGFYFACVYDKNGQKKGVESLLKEDEYNSLNLFKVGIADENIHCDKKIELSAENLLSLCKEKLENGYLSKIEDLMPLYLRKSQAEVSLEERLKKS